MSAIKTSLPVFRKNFFSSSLSTFTSAIIQLCLVAVLARYLSIDAFSIYIIAVAYVAIGEMASDFGLRVWVPKKVATSSCSKLLWKKVLIAKLFFSSVLMISLLFHSYSSLNLFSLFLCFFISISQPSSDPSLWFFRGRERLDLEAITIFIWRFSVSLSMGLIAVLYQNVLAVLGVWLFGNLLRMIVTAFVTGRIRADENVTLDVHSPQNYYAFFLELLPIGTSFLLMAIFQRSGIIWLDKAGSAEDIAVYGAASTLVLSAVFVGVSFALAVFPSLSRAAKDGKSELFCSILRPKLEKLNVFLTCCCFAGMMLSSLVIDLMYGGSYPEAKIVMVIMLPGLFLSSINFVLKYSLNALDDSWMDSFAVVLGLLFFVLTVAVVELNSLVFLAGLAWVVGELTAFIVRFLRLYWGGMGRSVPLLLSLTCFAFLILMAWLCI